MLKAVDGDFQHVKCIVCSFIQGKDMLLGDKVDTLKKHVRK
jgi:hypothetical protein